MWATDASDSTIAAASPEGSPPAREASESLIATTSAEAPPPPITAESYPNFDLAEEAALMSCSAGDYTRALSLFELALKLPGDGYDVRRVSVKQSPINGATVPRDLEEVRFASRSQQQTTYFNIACVHAKLADEDKALEALEKSLVLGFDDFDLVSNEADFEFIKADAARLVDKYKPKSIFDILLSPLRPKN